MATQDWECFVRGPAPITGFAMTVVQRRAQRKRCASCAVCTQSSTALCFGSLRGRQRVLRTLHRNGRIHEQTSAPYTLIPRRGRYRQPTVTLEVNVAEPHLCVTAGGVPAEQVYCAGLPAHLRCNLNVQVVEPGLWRAPRPIEHRSYDPTWWRFAGNVQEALARPQCWLRCVACETWDCSNRCALALHVIQTWRDVALI